MNPAARRVVIVGGGSAGWITACVIAAAHHARGTAAVTLVESPDVPTIGVGEGTWPSMRATLQRIGIAEAAFVRECDASFKQGTRFVGWSGRPGADVYLHPFSWPLDYANVNPATLWLAEGGKTPFADLVTPQAAVIAGGLAPKEANAPPFAFAVNYGYHLDAGKFATLLRSHAKDRLGVRHVTANVVGVESRSNGDIAALRLDDGAAVAGDLFVDCSGLAGLLIREHYKQRLTPAGAALCNDRAVVAQIPYANPDADPIASATQATAQEAGWIWDIGLATRRGVGYVYASEHADEARAQETLARYVAASSPGVDAASLPYRTISFAPGFRQTFWTRNCVAVGLAAGFVEPLEASALALVEQAAAFLADQLPRDREIMDAAAKRFNAKMRYHWERIVEFLKLHYAASQRADSAYWREHRVAERWPESLRDKMALWRQQPPWHDDAPMLGELFPSASYQYVLYGMGFRPRYGLPEGAVADARRSAGALRRRTGEQAQRLTAKLPATRDLVRALASR